MSSFDEFSRYAYNRGMDIEILKQEYLNKRNSLRTSQRNREVFEYRYGLLGNEPHTLKATGEKFGVGSERIRQITGKITFQVLGIVS